MKGGGIPLTQLAGMLRAPAGRFVVDKTGLSGTFEITLEYAPQSLFVAGDSDGPQLTTALREQLGLQLTAERAPLHVLVIDHVEHPTEN